MITPITLMFGLFQQLVSTYAVLLIIWFGVLLVGKPLRALWCYFVQLV